MSTPAIAGPIIRAVLNDVELSATAFGRSASPTKSAMKVCRAGASKAVAHPSRKASTYTCQSCTRPVTESKPSTRANAPIDACVNSRSLRRSK